MTLEEHKKLITDIMDNREDQAKTSELLTQLLDDYGSLTSKMIDLEEQNKKFVTDNETLRDTNMRLFLKVGSNVSEDNNDDRDQDTPQTYESLFDENGNLK